MDAGGDIRIRIAGRTGRITLNRPQALNALTYDMAMAIERALDGWHDSGDIDLVLIDAEGERAFCAGGDIADLYSTGRAGDFSFGRRFWADEYRMNAKIANSAIPYVAIMDGIVMGGGVGISAHGSDRIVTERSMIAMPECGIGLVPDVGGSFILSRAPGVLGEFLGLTGWRMNSGDAVLAGFADAELASNDLAVLKADLEEAADVAAIAQHAGPPSPPSLSPHLQAIDRHFSRPTALDCLRSLEADGSEFASRAAGL